MNQWTLLGLLSVMGSIGGYFIFPYGLEFGIKSLVNLSNKGLIFKLWSHPPFLTNTTAYLFQVQNPKQVLMGDKARVKPKGPYEFHVDNIKEDAEFSANDEQVELTAVRRFYFMEDASANVDERFYMVNPIVPATHLIIKRLIMDRLPLTRVMGPIVYNVVNVVLDSHNERLFEVKTPREVLFGYKIELLQNVLDVAKRFGLEKVAPAGPPNNIFGLIHFQNSTKDRFLMNTGVHDEEMMGKVIKWRDQTKMSMWKDQCNKIEGTNGEIHKAYLDPNKSIPVFLAQMCHSIHLDPLGRVNTSLGIEGLEFGISSKTFQGVRNNPSNLCFCKDVNTPECQYDGLITLEPCYYNVPLFMSRVNFLNADPRIKNTVEMVGKLSQLNKTSFYLEPMTGQILGADISLMINFKLQRVQFMRDLDNLRNISYVPFFITHEKIQLPMSVGWQLVALRRLVDNHGMLFLVSGAVGGAMAAFGLIKTRRQDNKNENETKKGQDKSPNKEERKSATTMSRESINEKASNASYSEQQSGGRIIMSASDGGGGEEPPDSGQGSTISRNNNKFDENS